MHYNLVLLFLIDISASWLAQRARSSATDSIFSEWNQPYMPGRTLDIIQNGELAHDSGYDLPDMEYDLPNSRSSVFRIDLTSKQGYISLRHGRGN